MSLRYYGRLARLATYRRLGWSAFAASLTCALLAIWLWDGRLLATAGVLLIAAIVLCFAGADL